MAETAIAELPEGYVRFFSFAAGEFEDEELFYCAARIAKAENRTQEDVEREFQEKLRYVRGEGQHPFQTWGPQELADRLNSYNLVEVEP
jgi:hypothetical protein